MVRSIALLLTLASACQPVPSTHGEVGFDAGEPINGDAAVPRSGPVWPEHEPLQPEYDFPPFLTMPAHNHVVVGFRTTDLEEAVVHLRGDDGTDRTVIATSADNQFFVADLGVLTAATEFSYEVEIIGKSARRRGVFLTSGRDAWRFVHLAEVHAESEGENVELFTDAIREFRPHLIIESGDMLDTGSRIESWREYFRISAPWISNAFILPIGSNHVTGSGGNAFLQHFFALPNNERWYATRYSQLEVFSLDSTYGSTRPEITLIQPAWLGGELRRSGAAADRARYLMGVWHYPACSTRQAARKVSREWVMDNFIDTFLVNGGVDLVLTGHDKYYERSLIDGRIPHITANAGKLAPSTAGDNHARCLPIVTDSETRSVVLGEVSDLALRLHVVDEDGDTIDAFTIAPRRPL